ncbi:MAG: glycosyltransferase family 1 protein [Sedimentisphaerales bacterium]|nr:glycosyltransferase family 1 protein [Sedimentisphaerales bacterium]
MAGTKRILIVTDTKDLTDKLLLCGVRKQVKGFIRLGYDAQVFSYNKAFLLSRPFRSKKFAGRFCKARVDELLARQIKNYEPDIILTSFAKYLDAQTIKIMRQAAAGAAFVGIDVDLWPELHKNRVAAAAQLDFILTTYNGYGLQAYKDVGIRCVFMPNMCDPDIEYRYPVGRKWQSDILFTGKMKHKKYPTEEVRYQIISTLSRMKNCSLYGCCGQAFIGGIQYLYAISGSKVALSINAVNDIRFYHSDRLTQYLACGTFVLAKKVPDSDLLFKDGVHLRYFDTAKEFFYLARWYLDHDDERKKIADEGMRYTHEEYNCKKIAQYVMDVVQTGAYKAPWNP